MLGFAEPINLQWQAAFVRNADISWISVNSSKPGRTNPFTLVVHSTNAWADAHMEDDIDYVRGHMLDEASLVTGEDMRSWRTARCTGGATPISPGKTVPRISWTTTTGSRPAATGVCAAGLKPRSQVQATLRGHSLEKYNERLVR